MPKLPKPPKPLKDKKMATYYVSTATGLDTDSGLTEALAWKTVDKAMNTVAAGDKVWVKADGNYNEKPSVNTVGTSATPIVFEGYTSTPGDGGRATVDGQSSRNSCLVDSVGAGTDTFYVFKNFRFTGSTGANVTLGGDFYTFKNCKFDTGASTGLVCGATACEVCEFTSNGGTGAIFNNAVGGLFVGCTFYSNGADGIRVDGGPLMVFGCIFYDNAGSAIDINVSNILVAIVNCTIDGNAKNSDDGVLVSNQDHNLGYINSVFYDCAVGIHQLSASRGDRVISRNNLVNGNTTAYTNAATFTGEVTAAPGFVDEAAGADYHPDTDSPLIGAGFDGGASMDIGAVQSVPGVTANAFQLKIGV